MMTKERGSDRKREGQRRSDGEIEAEGEPVLFRTLPVAVATSQRQYNHRTCFIFGNICGRKKEVFLKELIEKNDIFICYAALLNAIIFLE